MTNTETVYVDLTDDFWIWIAKIHTSGLRSGLYFNEVAGNLKVQIYVEGKQISDIHGVDVSRPLPGKKGSTTGQGRKVAKNK